LLRLAIRLLGLVSPALAGRWVYRLWFQPLRYPEPPQEQEWRRTAQPLAVAHRGGGSRSIRARSAPILFLPVADT
jgi:hypothetical protein